MYKEEKPSSCDLFFLLTLSFVVKEKRKSVTLFLWSLISVYKAPLTLHLARPADNIPLQHVSRFHLSRAAALSFPPRRITHLKDKGPVTASSPPLLLTLLCLVSMDEYCMECNRLSSDVKCIIHDFLVTPRLTSAVTCSLCASCIRLQVLTRSGRLSAQGNGLCMIPEAVCLLII